MSEGEHISEVQEVSQPAKPKSRDAVFDVAKGIGILLVLGHHSFSNSARLYASSHSPLWWTLIMANRVLSFSVPVFLLISAVLSSRSLSKNPMVLQFYSQRFFGILWPYAIWTIVYWFARIATDAKARAPMTGSIFGLELDGPSLLLHFHERWLDFAWGKASFHLYFMVVLFELIILLPLAVWYIKQRKPGFWAMLIEAFILQGAILVGQHYTALLPYPASNALWYIGSLIPGAWIGLNYDLFRDKCRSYTIPLSVIVVIAGALFLREEMKVIHGLNADNYLSNGSLTIYASCLALLVLIVSFRLSANDRARKILEPLGKNSLQIYLMHPGIMQILERPRIVSIIGATHLGPILSPVLMLGITGGLIFIFRVTLLEKVFFGRSQ